MGYQVKTFRRKPQSPISGSALRSSNNIVLLPGHSPSGIAGSQDFASLSTNALAIGNKGLTNPVLLNSSGALPSIIDPSGTDFGVYLPIPYCPVIQTVGGANSLMTVRWRGINHLGQPVYFTENKTNTTGGGTFFFQSQCAFSYIESCEILMWGNLTTDTFIIGSNYDFIQTGSAGPVKRIPLPFPISQPSDLAGITFVDLNGAVFAATPWAAGDQLLRWTTGSGLDLSSYPTSVRFSTGLVAMGRASTPPNGAMQIIVSQTPEARLATMREHAGQIVV